MKNWRSEPRKRSHDAIVMNTVVHYNGNSHIYIGIIIIVGWNNCVCFQLRMRGCNAAVFIQ